MKNYAVGDEFSLFTSGQQNLRFRHGEEPENIIYLGDNQMRKSFFPHALFIFVIGLFFIFNQSIKAQSALDGFDPNPNGEVHAIVVQPDGKIIIGGEFTTVSPNGGAAVTRNRIARFNPNGTLDTAFNPNAGGVEMPPGVLPAIFTIAFQSDGKILVGGNFTGIGGQLRNNIARLDATTGLADSFNPGADNWVYTIVVQPDGKILVGGQFSYIGGQIRHNIARLDKDTGLVDSFNPDTNNSVITIAIQPDGKILAGGLFTDVGGQPRNRIARLDPTTGAPDSFNPNAGSYVNKIAIQPDGKIPVGGEFTNIGGQSRIWFSRLTNDTAALSTLSVNRTTVTLTRNGAAALFNRVVFELSTDNGASWTMLGTATNGFAPSLTETKETGENQFATLAPESVGYTLTGLNLPTGQNILVRARGYVSGSESIEDKVQTALLLVPTAAQVSVSGRVLTSDASIGLRGAKVILTDASGNSRTTSTGSFGYFRFDDVQSGETYIVSVTSKRYQFSPQVVTVNEELSELNFTAQQ